MKQCKRSSKCEKRTSTCLHAAVYTRSEIHKLLISTSAGLRRIIGLDILRSRQVGTTESQLPEGVSRSKDVQEDEPD